GSSTSRKPKSIRKKSRRKCQRRFQDAKRRCPTVRKNPQCPQTPYCLFIQMTLEVPAHRLRPFPSSKANVRFWHKADIPPAQSMSACGGKADPARTCFDVRL